MRLNLEALGAFSLGFFLPLGSMSQRNRSEAPTVSTDTRYPNIAAWVQQHGWIEIGYDDFSRSFVRALDIGGMIWEGATEYRSLEEALQALDAGIAAWLEENRL